LLITFLANHGKLLKARRRGKLKMMKKSAVKKEMAYTVDLVKIDGDGAFPCPKCGVVISPDDETEEVYTILETKVKNDELAELTLVCNNCGSKIRLVGFLPQPES
jgi:predicted RNA-binding Zn-ribbon protein involved in translation (DUF1610 family)